MDFIARFFRNLNRPCYLNLFRYKPVHKKERPLLFIEFTHFCKNHFCKRTLLFRRILKTSNGGVSESPHYDIFLELIFYKILLKVHTENGSNQKSDDVVLIDHSAFAGQLSFVLHHLWIKDPVVAEFLKDFIDLNSELEWGYFRVKRVSNEGSEKIEIIVTEKFFHFVIKIWAWLW